MGGGDSVELTYQQEEDWEAEVADQLTAASNNTTVPCSTLTCFYVSENSVFVQFWHILST